MKFLFLIFLLVSIGLGEIVQRNYRKDGVKEFEIVKYVKGNKCDCSCKCNPQNQLKFFTDTTTNIPTTNSEKSKTIAKIVTVDLGKLISTSAKSRNMKIINVNVEANIVSDNKSTTLSTLATKNQKNVEHEEETTIPIDTILLPSEELSKSSVETTTIAIPTDEFSTEIEEEMTTMSMESTTLTQKETTPIQTEDSTTNDQEEITTTPIESTTLTQKETTPIQIEDSTTNSQEEITTTPIESSTLFQKETTISTIISQTGEKSTVLITDETTTIPITEDNISTESMTNLDTTTQLINENSTSTNVKNIPPVSFTTESTLKTLTTSQTDGITLELTTKEIAENESVEEITNETTEKMKQTKKIIKDKNTLTTKKSNNNTKFVNELGLEIANSTSNSSEEDIPEAEFSENEKMEHIVDTTASTRPLKIGIKNTESVKIKTTTLPTFNIDINSLISKISTTTQQTTTEDESEEVAFKIEPIDDKSLESVTEMFETTFGITESSTELSTTTELTTSKNEPFNVLEVLKNIEIVTDKVEELDSLESPITKDIYNLVNEIRSKFENTSTTLKIKENDQRLIQVKWSKLINKLREKLAALQLKRKEKEEIIALSTLDFETNEPKVTTPFIKVFSKKYKEHPSTDFSINEIPIEEKSSKSIQTLEERLEKAKNLREQQEKAQGDEKIVIEKTLDALAEKERLLREQADRQRLHFVSHHLSKARTIGDSTLIRQPLRRGPDPLEIDESTKLPQVQCEPVRNFIKIFKIDDPKMWIQENCQFVKQYFPSASCVQIKDILISCL
uniref:ShKT domain-containing protein n=1 Tax=Parastrongyloides trichosuri TaxID=131310 RepID=A0A0N4ZST4_PARTI